MGDKSQRLSFEQEIVKEPIYVVIPSKRYKSLFRLIVIVFVLALSAMQFGYGLSQISAVSMKQLQPIYGIDFSLSLARALLVGTMPIGGIFGGIANKLFLYLFTRKNAHYATSTIVIIGSALTQVPSIVSLFIGRFIIGIACGLYTAMAPVYIKEISPKQLKAQLGSLFGVFKVVGIVLCYLLGLIFQLTNVPNYFTTIFAVPGLLGFIQAFGIFFLVPDSPVQMVGKQKYDKAREVIAQLYEKEHVETILAELVSDYKAQVSKTQKMQNLTEIFIHQKNFKNNRKRAFLMGLNFVISRQFIGANCLVAYSGQIVSSISQTMATYTPVAINTLQLIGTIAAALFITKVFGRVPLAHFSTLTLALYDFAIAISLVFSQSISVVVFMLIYMITCGATYLPVVWAYPAEIVPPSQQPALTVVSWIAIAIVVIVPPIVSDAMPNQNFYPLFFFFGGWGIALQTKNRTYQQIINDY